MDDYGWSLRSLLWTHHSHYAFTACTYVACWELLSLLSYRHGDTRSAVFFLLLVHLMAACLLVAILGTKSSFSITRASLTKDVQNINLQHAGKRSPWREATGLQYHHLYDRAHYSIVMDYIYLYYIFKMRPSHPYPSPASLSLRDPDYIAPLTLMKASTWELALVSALTGEPDRCRPARSPCVVMISPRLLTMYRGLVAHHLGSNPHKSD